MILVIFVAQNGVYNVPGISNCLLGYYPHFYFFCYQQLPTTLARDVMSQYSLSMLVYYVLDPLI